MASLLELALRVRADTGELRRLHAELGRTADRARTAGQGASASFARFGGSLNEVRMSVARMTASITAAAAAIGALLGAGMGLRQFISAGVQFSASMETARIGIAAILTSTQKIVDAQGRQLEGAEKFAAATQLAASIQKDLQVINLQTAATTEQIVAAFQGILAPASAAGLTLEQTLETTKLMVQATSAMGLGLQQAVQEARDLLTGSIDMNSQLARSLGITNEQVKLWKEQGILFEQLQERLRGFELAGKQTQETWAGVVSNLKDAVSITSAEAFRPLFDFLKQIFKDIAASLVTVEEGQIRVNQRVVEFGHALATVIIPLLKGVEAIVKGIAGVFADVASVAQRVQSIISPLSRLTSRTEVALPGGGTRTVIPVTVDREMQQAITRVTGLREQVAALRGEARSLNEILAELKGGAQELGEGMEEADKKVKQLNDSIREQNEELRFQIATFGMSEEAVAKLNAERLVAQGVTRKLAEENAALNIELIKLKKAKEELTDALDALIARRKEEYEQLQQLKGALQDITTSILPEHIKLSNELAESLATIGEAMEKGLISIEEGWKLQAQVVANANEKITEAMRKEEIERLKNSDSFFDNLKGAWMEVSDSFKSTGEVMSDFIADTFNQIRNTIAGVIQRIITWDFKNLKDFWKATLEAMLQMAAQFAAALLMMGIFGGGRLTGNIAVAAGGGAGIPGGGIRGIPGLFGPKGLEGLIGGQLGTIAALGLQGAILGAPLGYAIGGAPGALIGGGLGVAGSIGGFALGGAIGAGSAILGPIGALLGGVIGGFLGKLFGSTKKAFDLTLEGELRKIQQGIEGEDFTLDSTRAAQFREPFMEHFRNVLSQITDALTGEALEAFLATEISIKGGGRFKDADKAAKNLEAFITGGFIRPLIEQTEDAFRKGFEQVGIDTSAAARFVDSFQAQLDDIFEATKDWEDRTKRGEMMSQALTEFLNQMKFISDTVATLPERFRDTAISVLNSSESLEEAVEKLGAFRDLVTLVEPEAFDATRIALGEVKRLAEELGFTGIPTMAQFRASVQMMLDGLELDPDTIAKYRQLRDAIVNLITGLATSIGNLASFIARLNEQIVSFGGTAVSTAGAVREAVESLKALLESGTLTLEERESVLDQLASLADQLAQEEMRAAERAREAQREAIQARIDALNREKERVREAFQARIEALQKELQIAQEFRRLTEQIRQDLERILFSAEAPLTPGEQIAILQSQIAQARSALAAATTDEARIEAIDRLRELQGEFFELATGAFGVGSPEQVAIFEQVTKELQRLQVLTDTRGKTVEQIQASIEKLNQEMDATLKRIDSQIETLNNQMSALGNTTAQVSQYTRSLYEYIRDQAVKLLDERLAQLRELGINQISGLSTMESIAVEQLTVLRDIRDEIAGAPGFQHGGIVSAGRGMFAKLHGEEVVMPLKHFFDLFRFDVPPVPPWLLALMEEAKRRGGRFVEFREAFRFGGHRLPSAQAVPGDIVIGDIIVNGATDPVETARQVKREIIESIRRGELRRRLQ